MASQEITGQLEQEIALEYWRTIVEIEDDFGPGYFRDVLSPSEFIAAREEEKNGK